MLTTLDPPPPLPICAGAAGAQPARVTAHQRGVASAPPKRSTQRPPRLRTQHRLAPGLRYRHGVAARVCEQGRGGAAAVGAAAVCVRATGIRVGAADVCVGATDVRFAAAHVGVAAPAVCAPLWRRQRWWGVRGRGGGRFLRRRRRVRHHPGGGGRRAGRAVGRAAPAGAGGLAGAQAVDVPRGGGGGGGRRERCRARGDPGRVGKAARRSGGAQPPEARGAINEGCCDDGL
jgi:hypothetical protein